MQTLSSASSGQTKKFAADLAKKIMEGVKREKWGKGGALQLRASTELSRMSSGQAVVLALQGDLGAGKTTFVQGLAKALGVEERITSPTFVLMKKFPMTNDQFPMNFQFPISKPKKFRHFYHFDCYRLQKPEEILTLDWQAIIKNPENIVAIEWPEKIKKLLPKNTIWLKFEYKDKNKRSIKLMSL